MFLSDTPRPTARKSIFQWLGLSRALERVSHDCIYQVEHSDCNTTLAFHPKPEVLKELRLKDGDPFRLALHRASLFAMPLASQA